MGCGQSRCHPRKKSVLSTSSFTRSPEQYYFDLNGNAHAGSYSTFHNPASELAFMTTHDSPIAQVINRYTKKYYFSCNFIGAQSQPGDVMFLVEAAWVKDWIAFAYGSASANPSTISNITLIDYSKETGGMILKENMRSKTHFRVVNMEVWEYLFKHYGAERIVAIRVPTGFGAQDYNTGTWIFQCRFEEDAKIFLPSQTLELARKRSNLKLFFGEEIIVRPVEAHDDVSVEEAKPPVDLRLQIPDNDARIENLSAVHTAKSSLVSAVRVWDSDDEEFLAHTNSSWTALHTHAARCELNELGKLIANLMLSGSGYEDRMSETDVDGRTPLHIAVLHSFDDGVKLLADAGSAVDLQDRWQNTALHLANTASTARILVQHGASTKIRNIHGYTPLLNAVRRGIIEVVEILLANGADVNEQTTDDGWSSLHLAVMHMDVALVRCVLSPAQVLVDLQDVSGLTPLHIICSSHYEPDMHTLLLMLLNANAVASVQNNDGLTALHMLVRNVSVAKAGLMEPHIDLLLESCSVNARALDGSTPLHAAAQASDLETLQLLVTRGGDLTLTQHAHQEDVNATTMTKQEELTVYDILSAQDRSKIVRYISTPQTPIPTQSRSECMICSSTFLAHAPRHNCQHCQRVVCSDCGGAVVPKSVLVSPIQATITTSNVRVCVDCAIWLCGPETAQGVPSPA